MMTEVLIPALENLPVMFITVQHVYEMNTGNSYLRYDLIRYDKTLLSLSSSEVLPKEHVKTKLIWEYHKIAYELIDFYHSPAYQSMKEYNETLKAIDNL